RALLAAPLHDPFAGLRAMSERRPTPEDARSVLAAEYVIGLTDPHDLPQVEAMIMRDDAFAASVGGWRRRLQPLTDSAPAIPPGELVWERIAATISPAPAPPEQGRLAAPTTAPPPPQAAPAARPARPAAAEDRSGLLGGLWRSLGFWRLVAAAGLAAAALLA